MKQMIRRGSAALVAGSLASLGMLQSANAAFTVPAEVTDAAVSVGLIGAAVFAIAVAIKLFKWLKGAL